MVRPHPMPKLTASRSFIMELVEGNAFVTFIIVLIIINAVTLGFETDQSVMSSYGTALNILDYAILIVFTIELVLKFYAYRFDFFRSSWNVFDLIIVIISWMPAAGPLSILRALRILRVLRLLSVVPALRRVISAIGHSIPGMMSVIGVLMLVFYISAVLTTKLFGQHPNPQMQEWFGSIGASAYTLFQIMTLESWSMGIVRPTMEIFPYAWVFFVPFIIITSFAVLNLFIGIIVDSMQSVHDKGEAAPDAEAVTDTIEQEEARIHERFEALQTELKELQQLIVANNRKPT